MIFYICTNLSDNYLEILNLICKKTVIKSIKKYFFYERKVNTREYVL